MSFTVLCVCVGNAINEIDQIWQQISHKLSEQDEIWPVDRGGLLYIRAKIGELWPREFPGAPK